jgi:hypothetical protein
MIKYYSFSLKNLAAVVETLEMWSGTTTTLRIRTYIGRAAVDWL